MSTKKPLVLISGVPTELASSDAIAGVSVNVSAGASSNNLSNLVFSNSNNFSFGLSGSTVTGSYTVPSTAGLLSAVNISGGTTSNNLSALVFSNSNGISFGLSGSTITGTVATNYQSQGAYLTTAMQSNAATISNINLSAGTTSNNLSALTFSNSNGISFGLSGSVITGTVKTDYQSAGAYLTTAMLSNAATISNINVSAGTTSNNLSALTFSNSNGFSFGLDGSTITGSYTVPSVTNSAWTASDSATSMSIAQLAFTNSNGFTMTLSTTTGGKATLIGSVATNYQSQGAYLTTAALSSQTLAFSLSGNTATTNSSQILNGGYALAGGNGVTLQQSNNTISISVATNYQSQAAYLTTAAQSTQTLAFSLSGNTATTNSSQITAGGYALAGGNGVTLQQSNNTVSISVATNYQSQGAYLTTAALSENTSNYAGINSAITGGSLTVNTSGISINLPAYLTTADLSANSSKYIQNWKLSGNTAGTTSSAQGTDLWFAGGNGVTISGSSNTLSFSVATNYQSQGAYLTTARGSTDAIGLNTAKTNVTWTANSSGLSLDAGGYAGTNTAMTGGSVTLNTSGISINLPAYLTTADLSANSSKYIQNWKLTGNTAGTTSSAQGTDLWLAGGNGLTISGSSNTLSFSVATNYQSQGAYLTTARASTDAIGLNTAKTNVTWTVNSSGISLDAGGYAGTNTATTGAISVTLNTSGISLNIGAYLTTADLSANSSKYVQEWALTGNTAGTTSSAQGTRMYFSGGNSITISGSSNSLVFSVGNYITTAMLSNRGTDFVQATAAFAGTNASGTIASNGISVSVAAPGAAAENNWMSLLGANVSSNSSASGSTIGWSGSNLTLAGTNNSQIIISAPATSSLSATGIVSISVNAGTISIGASQSAQTAGIYASSNTYLTSSGTVDARSLSFRGDKSITVGISSGEVLFSVGAYLTTARASTDAVGLNTALTANGIAWTVNSSGLSLNIPAFLTTAAQSTQTLAFSLSGNTATTNSSQITAGGYALAGGNGVTLQQSNNTVSISVATNYQSQAAYLTTAMLSNAATISNINVSAGATSNNLSAFVLSNSNNATFGLNGSTVTVSAPLSISAGATNDQFTNIVFSNSNGISFGLNGSTITASGDRLASYYANINNLNGMVTGASAIIQTSGASIFMQPFFLEQGISASFIRFIASYNDSAVGTAGTTSANTSYSVERYTTFGLGLYSQGVGASSRSLQQISSTSVGLTGRTKYTAGNTGSRYTVSIEKTFPQLGFATNAYATSYAVSSGSIVISSDSNTLFTGARFLDIPWLSSIPAGNYWLGIGASSSSNSNSSNISFAGTCAMPMSLAGVSQTNLSIGLLGAATSASDHQLFIGLGVWTTNASTFTRNSIGMDSISQLASNPLLPFQIIRMA